MHILKFTAVAAATCIAALISPAVLPLQHPNSLREVNPATDASPRRVIAIVGASLVVGRGGESIQNSTIVIRGDKILWAGKSTSARIPAGAEILHAEGMTALPGLMDSHFHIERDYELPRLYLSHGVTSLRDPGQWIEIYDPVLKTSLDQPRFFLCGPHLDNEPVAYPLDSIVVNTPEATENAVDKAVDMGASAIKVYFRLPERLVKVACTAAHSRGVPVTAHLELLDADKAIRAGIDGVEHVTSFGTALADPKDAEVFRAGVAANNDYRRDGRYALWSKIDVHNSPRLKPLIELIRKRGIFVSPTLAVFEVRKGDKGATEEKVRGFENMLEFIRLCHRAGVKIVVGSHSSVPHAERGWAYQREMELLVECGLTPTQAIAAATSTQAKFFRTDGRLGAIQPGKLADLILVEGDPTKDIKKMRNIRRVMLNGKWCFTSEEKSARANRG